jgi:hypothetical protein
MTQRDKKAMAVIVTIALLVGVFVYKLFDWVR